MSFPKFPFAIGISSLVVMALVVCILVSGCIPDEKTKKAIAYGAEVHLTAIRDIKAQEVIAFYEVLGQHATFLANLPETRRNLDLFNNYSKESGADPDGAVDVSTTEFKQLWNANQFLYDYNMLWEFYDVFLVNYDTGQVVYTAYREDDLGTNLKHGPYIKSGLAECYRQVVASHAPFLTDLAAYTPTYGYAAQFLGVPIFDNGKATGVLVIQVPNETLDKITQDDTGMGETGETYMVGADHLLRTNSRHAMEISNEKTALSLLADQDTVKKALAEKVGFDPDALDYDGVPVFCAYGFIDLPHGPRWAIISEIYVSEVMVPANRF